MPKLLVVDDDQDLRDLLTEYLSSRGHQVQTADDGETGLEAMRAGEVDLVVLDLMMPGIDGLEVIRRLRADSDLPIILLTARGDDLDRIIGLEVGADDYLAKPFNPRELSARIDAVLRRSRPARPTSQLTAGSLRVDLDRRKVFVGETTIDLTSTEFDLLRVLVGNAGRVMERDHLMEHARGEAFASFDRAIDVHISNIRKKLGDTASNPRFLRTVRGIGYVVPRNPDSE